MYLVVENLNIVENLGGVWTPESHEENDVLPKPLQDGVKLVNSILVYRVCIDDPSKSLQENGRGL